MIDYSQYSLWNFCKWAWVERYVRGYQRNWTGQRSDAMALGSLVHDGLDNLVRVGQPTISDETIQEIGPTPETLNTAQSMVEGYVRRYPAERWEMEFTEAPLRFPLCPDVVRRDEVLEGLAKVDRAFYVAEDTMIESGNGTNLVLGRGWWAREYKTKSPSVDRNEWMLEWQTKRQADFQLLALRYYVESKPRHRADDVTVRGVLVSVLEKPKEYVPQRTCKGCKTKFDMGLWRVVAEGYRCPACDHYQKLAAPKEGGGSPPDYWTMTVVRSPEQLEVARREILNTAYEMEEARAWGMEYVVPNRDNCVSNRWHKRCEYMAVHTYGGSTEGNQEFVQVDPVRYLKERV